MKLIDAINIIDKQKPNTYSNEDKVRWLSKLDGTVKTEIIDTHEVSESCAFTGYDENTPDDTELLIPSPYDDTYLYWLESRIDYANGEHAKYNNSVTMFNVAYNDFAKYYTRTHRTKTPKLKYF